jgi:dynein heavy chain
MSTILPIAKPLLGPHLDDLEKKIQPGMYILTWTSMNIDGYLHRIHNGLARLEAGPHHSSPLQLDQPVRS